MGGIRNTTGKGSDDFTDADPPGAPEAILVPSELAFVPVPHPMDTTA